MHPIPPCQLDLRPRAARRRRLPTLELTALALVAVTGGEGAAAPPKTPAPSAAVLVVASEPGGRYAEVVQAFEAALSEGRPRVRPEVKLVTMTADEGADRAELARALGRAPRLVVTLGRRATVEVVASAPERPLVAGLVVDAADLARAENATAVVLGHPFDVQLETLRRLLPDCGTFGIIHDARLTGPVRAAQIAAERLGLQLETRPVYTPKELPRAMASLSNSICALVGVPDPLVLSKHSAREVLLFSFRNRIPFIGPSESWVGAGALYALDWRYPAIGRQLAGLAARVIAGEEPRTIPRQWPDAQRLVINPGTAKKLGLTLSPDATREADLVE